MFWSGNYIVVRELNSLLKEENVTLTQVLEADDVLQECKADNKALIQFLTRPDILAELITLITEEPPKNVELGLQYRHASIACEVLTSQLSTLSDRLSMDTVQMNRLCDFINREPPLNPLLASYFSKTIEMLLERSPKQDWYLYHIVCLRVLDFLKARRDFLPNLLRHLHTSAAVDALKCFVRLNDLFYKNVMEWLEEHQFLESLVQIICGTYEPPPVAGAADGGRPPAEREEKGLLDAQGKEAPLKESPPAEAPAPRAVAAASAAALLCDILLTGCAGEGCQTRGRTAAALAAQATSASGVGALLQAMFTAPAPARRAALVHGAAVLLAMRRRSGAAEGEEGERGDVELCVAPHLPLLHTALLQQPSPREPSASEAPADGGGGEAGVDTVPKPVPAEPVPAKPVPAEPVPAEPVLRDPVASEPVTSAPVTSAPEPERAGGEEAAARGPGVVQAAPPPAPVGAARLQLAGLLAALAGSSVHEVAATMLTLGTPGVLIDMFFAHPDNNFLHAHVLALVHNALGNRAYRTQYARHMLEECDLVNRLIDAYEENENKRGNPSAPRSGYMGHVILLLRALAPLLEEGEEGGGGGVAERWAAFSPRLHAAAQRHDTPLGGYYPSANSYEAEGMVEVESAMYNNYNDTATYDTGTYETEEGESDRNKFLKLANQRMIEQLGSTWDEEEGEGGGGGGWDDGELLFSKEAALQEASARAGVLEAVSPWDAAGDEPAPGEGWAQFSSEPFGAPADPFAASDAFADAFSSDAFAGRESLGGRKGEGGEFWGYREKDSDSTDESSAEALRALRLAAPAAGAPLGALGASLADNLRTAMSAMTPAAIATIVNAGLPALVDPDATGAPDVSSVPSDPSVPAEASVPVVMSVPTEASGPTVESVPTMKSVPTVEIIPTEASVPIVANVLPEARVPPEACPPTEASVPTVARPPAEARARSPGAAPAES